MTRTATAWSATTSQTGRAATLTLALRRWIAPSPRWPAASAQTAIAGWYNGTLDLGPGFTRGDSLSQARELFTARLFNDGSTKSLSPGVLPLLAREPSSVALNAPGTHLAVAGAVDTGTANLHDVFIHHIDSADQVWTKQIGSTGQDGGALVAIDAGNNVLVAGITRTGPGVFACAGGDVSYSGLDPQLIIAELAAADGSCLWARGVPAATISAQGLLLDDSGYPFTPLCDAA